MTEQQFALTELIRQIQSHHYIEDYVQVEDAASYRERLGKQRAENEETLKSQGPVIIGGNLEATHVQAQYNDYALEVRGTLRAAKLVVEDKHVVTAGRFEVSERVDS